jgi:glycopeptide antibiotics resistance protein
MKKNFLHLFLQLGLLVLCLLLSQTIMFYFFDDMLVRVVGNPLIFILARIVLGIGLWILINLLIILNSPNKYKINNIILYSLYFIYCIFLISILFLKHQFPNYNYNLVPFLTLFTERVSTDILLIEMLANLLLFVFPGAILSLKQKSLFYYISIFLITSISIEVAQLILKRGVFDVTDIILNTLGGMLGLYIGRRLFKEKFYYADSRSKNLE